MSIIMTSFETISGFRKHSLRAGDRLRLTYENAKSPTANTATGTVTSVDDHNDHILVWLDIDGREPTYTLSLFNTDSNLHLRDKRGNVRTVNDVRTAITVEPIDET